MENPIFMGSSFGGNVALQLALKYPNKFKAVIPVEAAHYSPGFYIDWWSTLMQMLHKYVVVVFGI